MQYTVRNISQALDRALRARAKAAGQSLNDTVLELLTAASGIAEPRARYRKLDDLAGTWVDDGTTEQALADQRRVDASDWK